MAYVKHYNNSGKNKSRYIYVKDYSTRSSKNNRYVYYTL